MPHQNLPKELLEEFDRRYYIEREDTDTLFQDIYAAGYKDGILGAMEELGEETPLFAESDYMDYKNANLIGTGRNEYRSELLSRLEKRLNDGVQG